MFLKLLEELQQKGVEIKYTEGKLKYYGTRESLTEDLIERIKQNRGKLLRHFWPLKGSNFIPISTEGRKTPFVMIHGEAADYYLSGAFGDERPLFGFTHLGADGEHISLKSVEDYVEDYTKKLKTLIPNGPYILGGYSFGGTIAFEIACNLQAEGKDVPFLVLLDNHPPHFHDLVINEETVTQRKGFFEYLKGIVVLYYKKVYYTLRRKLRSLGTLLKIKYSPYLRKWTILDNYYQMLRKYKPKNKFKGKIVIFKALDNPFPIELYDLWKDYCDEIDIIPIRGDHETFLIYPESIQFLKDTVKNRVDLLNI